jgi:citrate synthase
MQPNNTTQHNTTQQTKPAPAETANNTDNHTQRHLQTKRSFSLLGKRLEELVPQKQEEVKKMLVEHGDKELSGCTVRQTVGGMRGVTSMLWETSLLDAQEGIRFRGYTIPELQQTLPGAACRAAEAKSSGVRSEPTPEALLWLLLTGDIPTDAEAASVGAELAARREVPAATQQLIRSFPKEMHPMTQLSMSVLALQSGSEFAAAYTGGMNKRVLYRPMLEDALNLIAKLPTIGALIFQNQYNADRDNYELAAYDTDLDYSANFNRMLGFPAQGLAGGAKGTDEFDELMRMYLVIHSDHEGGNVSAHATHLVGSALSDAYLSFAAGMNGLAGPLHGLANQEVLRWTLNFQQSIRDQGKEITKESVVEQAWATLNSGNVIPGFGHAVLRKTDPRYTTQREFALKYLPEDDLFKLVNLLFETIPGVLTEHGKTQNPFPNVDAHSGCLLQYYGMTQHQYYTVLFGISRAFGVLSQLFWDRALGLPLERPKSITVDANNQQFSK